MELTLFCQSLGLAIEEDEEGMVIVAGWDEGSAAAEHPSLMVGIPNMSTSTVVQMRTDFFVTQSEFL